MAMTGGGASGPQMNVTPLIDVLLVLIIIFMVIVTQTRTKGLEAQIPQPADPQTNQAPPPARTVVIQLRGAKSDDETPKLSINSEEVGWPELQPRLHDIFKTRAEKVAFVQGEDAVEFRFVAEVIDEARAAGVERVGLMRGGEAQRPAIRPICTCRYNRPDETSTDLSACTAVCALAAGTRNRLKTGEWLDHSSRGREVILERDRSSTVPTTSTLHLHHVKF